MFRNLLIASSIFFFPFVSFATVTQEITPTSSQDKTDFTVDVTCSDGDPYCCSVMGDTDNNIISPTNKYERNQETILNFKF